MPEDLPGQEKSQTVEQLQTAAHNFDDGMQKLINRYYQIVPEKFKPRGTEFFRWSYVGSTKLLLSCVPEELHTKLARFNTMAVLLNAMIDDLADLVQNPELVMEALAQLQSEQKPSLKIAGPYLSYLGLIHDVRVYLVAKSQNWESRKQWYPALKRFLQRYQMAMLASIKHNQRIILGDPSLTWINLDRYIIDMSPPIHTGLFILFNLMMSSPAPQEEMATIEHIMSLADQYMVMANWLATWQEEVVECDYSSGVIAYTIEQGYLEGTTLSSCSRAEIKQIIQTANPEREFFTRMKGTLGAIRTLSSEVSHFDVNAYADALNSVAWMHLDHSNMLKHGVSEVDKTTKV